MPFAHKAERLRCAVAAGSFGEVDQLLVELGVEVELRWRSASNQQRLEIASETTNLLEWAKHSILAARAHAQLKQAQLTRQSAYSKPAPGRSYLEIDG